MSSSEAGPGLRRRLVGLAALAGATVLGAVLVGVHVPGGQLAWIGATTVALAFAAVTVATQLARKRVGVDLIALLALAGSLAVGEYLAGAVIGVMLTTGQVLEGYAARRAHRDLSELLDRAPRTAHVQADGQLRTVPAGEVAVGDVVVVRSGEVVPVDARLIGSGVFDESALTGESLPVSRPAGDLVRSGVVNAGAEVAMQVVHRAEDSSYAGVVRLAEQAVADAAPVVRLADRFAMFFLPLTLAAAGAAWWASGDPVRAVAVLVTATPCPLLLAVPVAVTAGMSAASRCGVVVKDGAALERLGQARTAVLDKTGTVTLGRPRVTQVISDPSRDRAAVLAAAAAVERHSPHVLAAAVVAEANRSGAPVPDATGVVDRPGVGAEGVIDGERVAVGRLPTPADGLPGWARTVEHRATLDAAGVVWVTIAGQPAAALLVQDEIRPDAARTLARLRAAGLRRLVLLTGDRRAAAEDAAGILGLDELIAGVSPAEKVERVRAEQRHAVTLAAGDGVNDAPALAVADVGVALGARGATAAAQAADAVLTDDRIDRLADAVDVAHRARGIAVQSAAAGMGLSLLAMGAAAAGWLPPAAGALVQEAIDVVVILSALRALLRGRRSQVPPHAAELIHRFTAEHADLLPARGAVRAAADALSAGATPQAEAAVRRAHRLLVDQLLPHEVAEENELYPAVAPAVGGRDGTAPMSRGHAEIHRLARRLSRHLVDPGPLREDQVDDLRATLYGLDAVLTLHFAQEEQSYFTLAEPRPHRG
ncbi:heavy metal translocating P-type ATPase [Gandjariella thermophila]|uniref:ATPase P n=1 Tax=Gandjariella thermophila TaxID=1931992 RepID=A0A4D4JGP5_9PSEU|nr:heavy metal translocating P-type ATPase [Gandjariella thermophila]GDY33808.1 ATPase P [Gandjariella thermophila]